MFCPFLARHGALFCHRGVRTVPLKGKRGIRGAILSDIVILMYGTNFQSNLCLKVRSSYLEILEIRTGHQGRGASATNGFVRPYVRTKLRAPFSLSRESTWQG